MQTNPFLAEAEIALGRSFTHGSYPAQLLDKWAYFVNGCSEGYQWDISEYDNELSVRKDIEEIIRTKRLKHFSEIRELKLQISDIDKRFKALLKANVELPNRDHWWEKGVLIKAGEPYATYIKKVYGIQIEIV